MACMRGDFRNFSIQFPFWRMAGFNSIRAYVFIAIIAVSILPMVALLLQAQKTAFERELQKIEHSHLIIAANLASTLDRYAQDLVSAFDFLVEARGSFTADAWEVEKLARHYKFRYVALANKADLITPISSDGVFPNVSSELLQSLRREAVMGKTVISGIKLIDGTPILFAVRSLPGDKIAFAAFDTEYLRKVQKAVAFGENGHSMIVDKGGRVIAHPNPTWQAFAKDASGLQVVQRMITGNSGVMQFYAPPLKADVIAGYTFVPFTGWGVMIPQPIAELELSAQSDVHNLILLLALLAGLAVFGGWILSGLIAKPVQHIMDTVGQIRDGNLNARVPDLPAPAPNELEDCRLVFNGLMDKLSADAEIMKGALDVAKEADRAKSRFIAVLSHEMRTPLNGIVATLDLLSETELSVEQQEYFKLLETSSASLTQHVNDVLDINCLSYGKMKLDLREFSVSRLLKRIILENEARATKLGNTIELSINTKVPDIMRADLKLTEKIVSNLVSNAVKYTEAGQIVVTAELAKTGALIVSVQDTGIGIAEEDLERIFEPFTTLNAEYARSREGTGLGLSIVKGFVEAIDGEIFADSILGEGSMFQVLFPIQIPSDRSTATAIEQIFKPTTSDLHSLHGHVLVVEDNHVNTLVLSKLLVQLGLEVSCASDGFAALNAVKKEKFDLILMDISMPDMDGTEVAKIVRSNKGPNQGTPIIAQTAHAMPSERTAFANAGMQSVLIKPISRLGLKALLNEHLIDADPANHDAMNQPVVCEALDKGKFSEVVELVGVEESCLLVVAMADGVDQVIEKLQTDSAVGRKMEELAALAHKVAGTSAVLGAVSLNKALIDIQNGAKVGSLARIAVIAKELSMEMERADGQITESLAVLTKLRQA